MVNIGHHSNGFAHSRRNTDVFGRFGGEEFIFVLPDTPLEKAALFADKIRRIIGSIDFEDAEGGRFKKTVSF